jgi:hypothetical protein
MVAALGVIIGKHHNIGATQVLGIFGAPVLASARIRRGREPDVAEVVDILLAFGDLNGLPGGHRLHEFGQPVWYAARVL